MEGRKKNFEKYLYGMGEALLSEILFCHMGKRKFSCIDLILKGKIKRSDYIVKRRKYRNKPSAKGGTKVKPPLRNEAKS